MDNAATRGSSWSKLLIIRQNGHILRSQSQYRLSCKTWNFSISFLSSLSIIIWRDLVCFPLSLIGYDYMVLHYLVTLKFFMSCKHDLFQTHNLWVLWENRPVQCSKQGCTCPMMVEMLLGLSKKGVVSWKMVRFLVILIPNVWQYFK